MIALIFPGQGSQYVGMADHLADPGTLGGRMFEEASNVLGYDLLRLCMEGPEDKLADTLYAQPAIFTVSCIMFESLPPAEDIVAAGHSLGEYAALKCAKSFSFDDGVRIVAKRAELMAAVAAEKSGNMYAVLGAPLPEVEKAVAALNEHSPTFVANENSPEQTVISTSVRDEALVRKVLAGFGAKKAVKLAVSGAFHSPTMLEAADSFRDFLEEQKIAQPLFPVLSNYDAEFMETAADIRDKLANQLVNRVRWTQIMERMASMDAYEYIEVGPGKVLQGLVKRNLPQARVRSLDTLKEVRN